MVQVNGRPPDEHPRSRGLADRLRLRVDGLLPCGRSGEPQRHDARVYSVVICQAAGEMIETETAALATEWSKRFTQLQAIAENQTTLIGRLLDRVELLEGDRE